MTSVYPGDPPGSEFDVFSVPTEPEGTPLSSAGTATRNHTELHDAVSAAVETLQTWAALRTHDHSGDPGDITKGSKLAQANTHQSPDTDGGTTSLHHTLGTGAYQAAPGNHIHDYDSGTIINKPLIRCTSLTRPTSPYLGLQIYEIDTNRTRVWAQFTQNNVASQGVFATDDFERASLGADWDVDYLPDTTGGEMVIGDGHNVVWDFDYDGFGWPFPDWVWGQQQGRAIARNTKASIEHTITDDQILTWESGSDVMPWYWPWPSTPSSNDFYLRMSDDKQSYIRLVYTYQPYTPFYFGFFTPQARATIMVYATKTGPEDEELIGSVATALPAAFSVDTVTLIGRTLTFYRGSEPVGQVIDRNNVSNKGAGYRGWGMGMTVGRHDDWLLSQRSHPDYVGRVTVSDAPYYTGTPVWQLMGGSVPVVRLRQATTQQLSNSGTIVTWNEVLEDPFGFFNPQASNTNIVIKEPGVYQVEAALQWDPQYVPDIARVVFCLNGVETTIKHQAQMRGGGGGIFVPFPWNGPPGISQTMYVSGKIRFAANDVLTLKASYTAASSLLALIFSYWESASNIKSRIDVSFISP